jgi:D-lactate dehydrogenase (cytochrome)
MFSLLSRRATRTAASSWRRTAGVVGAASVIAGTTVYWINRHNINNSSNNSVCLADNSSSNESTQTASSIEPLLIELKTVLRSDQIELDIRECKSRGKPWSSFHKISEYPEVIVYPESTQNVSDVMRLCYKHRVPVVPFGGGTSLEGQILATRGGLSLDFNHMKSVVELNEKDMDMTVQAGLGYVELNEILRDKDLWFPLDPGPGASVGGMCACRCSGSTAVRYGSMRY